MTTITGIMPLRNATLLGYPYELALRSLKRLCDEVVVAVDPTSEDDTLERVRALNCRIVAVSWDLTNHGGHEGRSEIARQTVFALEAARGDWVFSLQADEVLHEREVDAIRRDVEAAALLGVDGFVVQRLYFYGDLEHVRTDWTVPLLRLFRRGTFAPDGFSGAMQFVPVAADPRRWPCPGRIYHYSRVGDAVSVAKRVRNLDTFYHPPERVAAPADVPAYDFGELRKLDTYVLGHQAERDERATLVPFPLDGHPAGVLEHFA